MHTVPFLSEASFETLLGNKSYAIIGNLVLFYQPEQQRYVIAEFRAEAEYTTNDYYQLPEEAPFQLINGKFVQTMGASILHQRVLMKLSYLLHGYVDAHKLGEILTAPTDVVLGHNNVFQPDILFVSVARQSQLQTNRIVGAPEFVVEILSKSTEENDRTTKMTEYGLYDVLEYWLVHPTDEFVEVYHNHNRQLHLVQTARKTDSIQSVAIEGFVLNLEQIF